MIKSMLLAVVMVKAHNNALLSPLSRLGLPTLRYCSPKALRYVFQEYPQPKVSI